MLNQEILPSDGNDLMWALIYGLALALTLWVIAMASSRARDPDRTLERVEATVVGSIALLICALVVFVSSSVALVGLAVTVYAIVVAQLARVAALMSRSDRVGTARRDGSRRFAGPRRRDHTAQVIELKQDHSQRPAA